MKKREIESVEYWGKSHWENIAGVSMRFPSKPDKPIDWIMQKRIMVGPEYYQIFTNIGGMRFNWLVKLWCKLNGLT